MINLFVNPFEHKNPARVKEFHECQHRNKSNKYIDRIIEIRPNENATYQDFLDAMRDYPNDVNVMSNYDIYFDDSIRALTGIKPMTAYAITRHEVNTGEIFTHNSPRDSWNSQDVWVFPGAPVDNMKFVRQSAWWPFPLGIGGCDNHFAWLLNRVGYQVINPAYSVKCWHIHGGGFNNRDWHGTQRIGHRKAYMVIKPSYL